MVWVSNTTLEKEDQLAHKFRVRANKLYDQHRPGLAKLAELKNEYHAEKHQYLMHLQLWQSGQLRLEGMDDVIKIKRAKVKALKERINKEGK